MNRQHRKYLFLNVFLLGVLSCGFLALAGCSAGTSGSGAGGSGGSGGGTKNQFLFVTSGAYTLTYTALADQVFDYSINASTGVLTPVTSISGNSLGDTLLDVVHNFAYIPSYVYTSNASGNVFAGSIGIYSTNTSNGSLTQIGTQSLGTSGVVDAIDPKGRFLYTHVAGAQTYQTYSISASTGLLTPIGSAPMITAQLNQIIFDHTGNFAYGTYENGNGGLGLYAYSVNPTSGMLTLINTYPGTIYALAIDPSNKFLYCASQGSSSVYSINATTGALTVAHTYSGLSGSFVFSPAGTFAFVSTGTGVDVLSFNSSTGSLGSPSTAYSGAVGGIAIDSTGSFAYGITGSNGNQLTSFSINPTTGVWTQTGTSSPVSSGYVLDVPILW